MAHYVFYKKMVLATTLFPYFLVAQKPKTPILTTPEKTETAQKNIVVSNERAINTRQLEFSPAFFEDGIVFISSQKPVASQKVFDNRIESSTMSIFLARRDENGQLGKPTAFANSLVSSLHEGPLTFDKTAENIFFSRNNSEKNGKKARYTEGVSRLKIYTSQREGQTNWRAPTELSFNQNNSDACHPSISVDGDKLYFSSNRTGGYGGMDLYVCERTENGGWGKPRNLGPKVNTARNEIFPFIHADGTLFYSSDGLKGSGGLDIFYAKWTTADFSNMSGNAAAKSGFGTPTNLGEPFNSDKDDFGFIVDLDMKNGYFTSNKQGGVGSDDIYSFNINDGTLFDADNQETPEILADNTPHAVPSNVPTKTPSNVPTKTPSNVPTKTPSNVPSRTPSKANSSVQNKPNVLSKSADKPLNLLVLDRQTGKPIAEATAAFLNLNELSILDIVINDNGKQTPFIKSDGTFALELVASKMSNFQTNRFGKTQVKADKTGNYVISITKTGYSTEQITLKSSDEQSDIVVLLDRFSASKITTSVVPDFVLQEGMSLKLNNVYYNFNDGSIRPDAAKDLDALYTVMMKYPDMEIELGSYTDARGTTEFNLNLSQRRAESAVQYLVTRGIDAQRIVAKGYGENHLRNHCSDGVPCSENEHKINRRTEVKITKSGSAQEQVKTEFFTTRSER